MKKIFGLFVVFIVCITSVAFANVYDINGDNVHVDNEIDFIYQLKDALYRIYQDGENTFKDKGYNFTEDTGFDELVDFGDKLAATSNVRNNGRLFSPMSDWVKAVCVKMQTYIKDDLKLEQFPLDTSEGSFDYMDVDCNDDRVGTFYRTTVAAIQVTKFQKDFIANLKEKSTDEIILKYVAKEKCAYKTYQSRQLNALAPDVSCSGNMCVVNQKLDNRIVGTCCVISYDKDKAKVDFTRFDSEEYAYKVIDDGNAVADLKDMRTVERPLAIGDYLPDCVPMNHIGKMIEVPKIK